MSKRAKEWAKKARASLIESLGGKCANPECGETDYGKLTIDHLFGKDYETTGLSTDQRMLRYRKEAKLNLLQCLCLSCNSKRGNPRAKADQEKNRLLYRLGHKCANGCPEIFYGDLHFSHINGPDWDAYVPSDLKLKIYQNEMDDGNLRVLCTDCMNALSENEVNSPCEPF